MNLFQDKTRNSLQLGRIPPRCMDDTVCCAAAAAGGGGGGASAAAAAAAAGWLSMGAALV